MADKELVIKISGDLKDYQSALNMAQEETEHLSDALGSIAKVSGIAFAALTAEIFLSVRALNVEAEALDQVNNALQNQGIYSDALAKSYRDTAEAIEKKTGVDADSISSGQAAIQGLIGQQVQTDALTRSIVDFSKSQKLDLNSSFTLIGKAIQGNVGALGRYGISIEDNLTKNERLQKITEVLGQKFGGSAEKSANAAGSLEKFTAQIGNAQKEIGRRFQPAFDKALDTITGFIEVFNENKAVADFAVACIAAGVAVSGVALVASVAGIAFLKLKAAMLAAEIATGAMTIATRALLGATGLGLLVIILSEIYLNWSTIWPRMQVIYQAFVDNIINVAKGLGKILYAVFVPSTSSLKDIEDGAKQVADALKKGYGQATQSLEQYGPEAPKGKQDPGLAAAAKAQDDKERDAERRKRETRQAELELSKLQEEKASLDSIDLKKQEIEILKALEDDKNKFMRSSLEQRLAETKSKEIEQLAIDKERRAVLNDELLANNEAFQQLDEAQKADFLARNQQQIEQGILTSKTVKQEAVKQELEIQKSANNQFLLEQQKYGTAYATINKGMHSAVYQGTKQAFGELADLQNSTNSTLKGIGKAAAVANIVIRTAESAMNIYAGFSTIPIIGPALGVAGAAAAVAFGAEQVSKVNAAADGALVTGGIRGRDSVPYMLSPGELVVPQRNFEEVIGSTAASRAGQSLGGGSNGDIIASLESLTQAVLSMPRGGVTINGDYLADEVYADRLLKSISDRLESGNGKLFGVNT